MTRIDELKHLVEDSWDYHIIEALETFMSEHGWSLEIGRQEFEESMMNRFQVWLARYLNAYEADRKAVFTSFDNAYAHHPIEDELS
jgi:hypothetical protein